MRVRLVAVVFSLAVIAGGAFAWFYYLGPCGKSKVTNSARELRALRDRWKDAMAVAGSAPRFALAGPVQALQKVKQEAAAVEVPGCMAASREDLVAAVSASIDGMLSFMQDSEEAAPAMGAALEILGAKSESFEKRVSAAVVCSPWCG